LRKIRVITIRTRRDALGESDTYKAQSRFSPAAKAIGWMQFPTVH
jgi:hypothetical protein